MLRNNSLHHLNSVAADGFPYRIIMSTVMVAFQSQYTGDSAIFLRFWCVDYTRYSDGYMWLILKLLHMLTEYRLILADFFFFLHLVWLNHKLITRIDHVFLLLSWAILVQSVF